MILLGIALQASAGVAEQALHDEAAARLSAPMHGRFRARSGERIDRPAAVRVDRRSTGWRTVTDEDLRARSGYHAPRGYRFHRAVGVDLDHDGRKDVVEMVERPHQHALRISYGGSDRVLIAAIHDGQWTDQGLFAAGTDAVMVNFPESSVYFLFQRGRELRIAYTDD